MVSSHTTPSMPSPGSRALDREAQPPLCLVRELEGQIHAWIVAPSAQPASVEGGEGPVGLVLPVAAWQSLGVGTQELRLSLPSTSDETVQVEGLEETVRAVLAHEVAPPAWMSCIVSRPGGVHAHWTPEEAAAALVGPSQAALIRRFPATASTGRAAVEALAAQLGLPVVELFPLCERLRIQSSPGLLALPGVTRLPTPHGTFQMSIFENLWTGAQHVVLSMGDLRAGKPPLVRLHSECFTGDIMGSLRCDCGPQLDAALRRVAADGLGAVLYLRQEGRGIGLYAKMQAYVAQDGGLDTVEANTAVGFPPDLRSYDEAAEMLRQLGVAQVRLLTNNPLKIEALRERGMNVVSREPHQLEPNAENAAYLETKRLRMGHLLHPPGIRLKS